MAPSITNMAALSKRQNGGQVCRNGEYYSPTYGGCISNWNFYGRWVFAGIVIAILILIGILWTCVKSRRRRRNGQRPMYGTGWLAPAHQYGPGAPYGNQPPAGYHAPPPAYGAPPNPSYPMHNQAGPVHNQPTGTTFNTDAGYYGQHEGISPPKQTYQPPEGPPPGKH